MCLVVWVLSKPREIITNTSMPFCVIFYQIMPDLVYQLFDDFRHTIENNPPVRYDWPQPEIQTGNAMSNCFWLALWSCCRIAGSEESSSSPVVRSGEGGGGGGGGGGGSSASNSSSRKKKYAPNEQGRYVCTQCGRSYAAYHVNHFDLVFLSFEFASFRWFSYRLFNHFCSARLSFVDFNWFISIFLFLFLFFFNLIFGVKMCWLHLRHYVDLIQRHQEFDAAHALRMRTSSAVPLPRLRSFLSSQRWSTTPHRTHSRHPGRSRQYGPFRRRNQTGWNMNRRQLQNYQQSITINTTTNNNNNNNNSNNNNNK